MSRAPIAASGHVAAPPEAVQRFLADLENHRQLTSRELRALALEGPVGARRGGRFLLRGPLGLRRAVATTLDFVADDEIRGTAALGGGTRAAVRWQLTPNGGGTAVRLEATVLGAGALDRLLLALGARRWLIARFGEAITALAAAPGLSEPPASARPRSGATAGTP
jgi:hypothetical protein